MVVLNYLNEIWKDISGFNGIYQASNYGRIKSLYFNKVTILKSANNGSGYPTVVLCKNKQRKTYLVHRLVWETFNDEIPEGMQVNHINECKTDNRLENLELMTRKENCNYGTRNQRLSERQINDKTKSKHVFQYSLNGEFIKEWESAHEIERILNYNRGNICNCCRGIKNSANGYKWSYKNI